VSGPGAVAAVAPLIRGPVELSQFPSHRLRRVTVQHPRIGTPLDDALCAVMWSPRSYTGEDVVELSCHGSPALLRLVAGLIVEGGARLAAPGEFTRRAFVNGRLDLAQAEAVALMISARTARAVALAARGLAGGLSARASATRAALVDVIAGLEVSLDFPDDRVGLDVDEARKIIGALAEGVGGWLATARRGRVVLDGVSVALVGPPNAGKSSLLNALLGSDRAIVSPVPGTTRDVVEGTIALEGVPVRLLDTAGLDAPRDAVEAEGMRRSRRAIEESDALVVVLDGSAAPELRVLEETAGRARVVVLAKSDLPPYADVEAVRGALRVSSVTGEGLGALLARLTSEVVRLAGDEGDEEELLATLRQIEQLEALQGALIAGGSALGSLPVEVAIVDLREALDHVGALLGVEVADDVLDRVFASFCVGK